MQVQSADNNNINYSYTCMYSYYCTGSMRQQIHKWKRQLHAQLRQEYHLLQAIEQTKGGVCALLPTSASAAAPKLTKRVVALAGGADGLYRELLQTAETEYWFDHGPVCDWRTLMQSTQDTHTGMNDSVLQMYRSSTVLLEMVEQSLANRKDVLREACHEFVLCSLGSEAKMAMKLSPSLDPDQIIPIMANTILERFHKIVLEQESGGDNSGCGGEYSSTRRR
jgi:hypothetical protein